MARRPTSAEKRRALPWALAGDAANTVYVNLTFAGPVFLLFLDKLALDKIRIGILLAIFPLFNLVTALLAPIVAAIGFKRIFLSMIAARSVVLATLISVPWVIGRWGLNATYLFIIAVITAFSLCRSTAFLAFATWVQEFVPNPVRGKFSAAQNIVFVLMASSALAAAGGFLGQDPPISRFSVLFAIGFCCGLLSVVLYGQVPGGASTRGDHTQRADWASMVRVLKDRQFLMFLAGGALVILGWLPLSMGSFLPLFLKEQVDFDPRQVLYYNAAFLGSGVISCTLWGWAADRYGGKPVLLTSLGVLCFYPVALWVMPRDSSSSFAVAMVIAAVTGLAVPGWSVGYSRLLYVKLIRPIRRSAYIAVHHAWMGLISGLVPLLAGLILHWTASLDGSLGFLVIDPYTPLMWSGPLLMGGAMFVIGLLASDGRMPVVRFAGMFIQGNALAAMQGLVAYRRGGLEGKRVSTIERLGQARSPLNIQELAASLNDPSFNVRFEAVISIARTRPNPMLTKALIEVLKGAEPDMRITAAWALGRMGDQRAAEPLREAMDSRYPLLRARAARALGTLGDTDSAAMLLERFGNEPDHGVKLAYGSALGAIRCQAGLVPLLDLLMQLQEKPQRQEIALAIAMIAGREDWFVLLARRVQHDAADALGGALLSMRRRLTRGTSKAAVLPELIDRCLTQFGTNDMERAVGNLIAIVRQVPGHMFAAPADLVLRRAASDMERFGAARLEYATLCMHILHSGFGATAQSHPPAR